MKIDTIKKKELYKNVINLKKEDKTKKIITKNLFLQKSDYFFYTILIILMIFVIFVWFFSFKNNLKIEKAKELENKAKYEELLKTYNNTKSEIDKGVETIKERVKSMVKPQEEDNSLLQPVLGNLSEEEKNKILQNINNPKPTTVDQEIKNSLNQKELQYQLDSLK